MMGPRQEAQPALFYAFSPEDHIPTDHLLRSIERFVDLSSIRAILQISTVTQAAGRSIPSC